MVVLVIIIVGNLCVKWIHEKEIVALERRVSALEQDLRSAYLTQLRIVATMKRDLDLTRRVLRLQDRLSLLEAELLETGRIQKDYVTRMRQSMDTLSAVGGSER